MYNLVPADDEARKLPPKPSVYGPDGMADYPDTETSSRHSGEAINGIHTMISANPRCNICDKTYKNKRV